MRRQLQTTVTREKWLRVPVVLLKRWSRNYRNLKISLSYIVVHPEGTTTLSCRKTIKQDNGSHMFTHGHEAPLRYTGWSSLQHVAWGETTSPATNRQPALSVMFSLKV